MSAIATLFDFKHAFWRLVKDIDGTGELNDEALLQACEEVLEGFHR